MQARRFLLAATVATLVACGGGGGNFAGIDRLGVTSGTVNGFGSIIVNGVHYEVNGQTSFTFDDVPGSGSQSDLDVGDQVTISWTSTDGGVTRVSESVSYDDTLEGPIAAGSIDALNQRFVVLGQTVQVDAGTSFDSSIQPRDLSGLADGQYVEVSGLIDAAGVVRATRIEAVDAADDDLEVRGIIVPGSLDTLTETFLINGLTVDYSGVLNPPALAGGQFVEVTGEILDAGTNTLFATRLQVEDEDLPGAGAGDDGEVEGYVTRFASATDFDVAGTPTTTNAQTQYENGVAGDLALNARLEVKGALNASGVLVAIRIEFKSGGSGDSTVDARVAGNVTAVNPVAGTLVIAGVTVTVTASTRLEDESDAGLRPFGIGNINVGNYIEARGTPGGAAALTAFLVERDDARDPGELRGPAGAIVQPDLTVLGVPVTTDGATQYRLSDNQSVSAGQFFTAITDGSNVRVSFSQGAQAGGAILASTLQIELEEDD